MSGFAFGQDQPRPGQTAPASQPLQKFVRETLRDLRTEVGTADLASVQGADPQVKAMAKTVVDDYTKTADTLVEIARARGAETVGAPNIDLDVGALKGAEFDRKFLKDTISRHTATIERLQLAQKQIGDSELNEFIAATLPLVQSHLDRAKALVQTGPDKLSEK